MVKQVSGKINVPHVVLCRIAYISNDNVVSEIGNLSMFWTLQAIFRRGWEILYETLSVMLEASTDPHFHHMRCCLINSQFWKALLITIKVISQLLPPHVSPKNLQGVDVFVSSFLYATNSSGSVIHVLGTEYKHPIISKPQLQISHKLTKAMMPEAVINLFSRDWLAGRLSGFTEFNWQIVLCRFSFGSRCILWMMKFNCTTSDYAVSEHGDSSDCTANY